MTEKQAIDIKKYLQIARKCIVAAKYDQALAHFVCLCNLKPSLKTEIEPDFMTALCKCTEVLEQHGEYRKIAACFQEAAFLYPNNEGLLNNIGGTLFRLGLPDESASYFRRALHLNPANLQAKESLENVSNTLVERWHFRMLNDKERNSAYKVAITKAVKQGSDVVLDIGSGSGILSMFAVQAGAKRVYACELSKTMCEVSQDVLKANNMENSVQLINKKSTEMCVGKDIPCPVNLVVTETMDCGLLGEGILTTMLHAWEHLLAPCKTAKSEQPVCRVIPCGAVLYGMAITAPDIRQQTRCKAVISEINMSSVNIIGGDHLDPEGDPYDLVIDPIEPYTTESLTMLRSGYTPLSDPFVIADYNFCDPKSLKGVKKLNFKIPVTQSGNIDAIAVWFDLHLDDQICISTGPSDSSLCWEQAVYPVFPHHLMKDNSQVYNNEVIIHVNEGDTLHLKGIIDQEYLKIQCSEVKSCSLNNKHMSTDSVSKGMDSLIVNSSSANTDVHVLEARKIEYQAIVPHSYMARANDPLYMAAYKKVITESIDVWNSLNESNEKCKVIEHTIGLPMCALVAASKEPSEVLITNTAFPINVLEYLRETNGIPTSIHYGPTNLEDIARGGRCWDIFITDLIEPSGVLRQHGIEDIVFSRGCLLKQPCGIVIPAELHALSLCIDSEALISLSKVANTDNTLGLEIGSFMNEFQASTQINIDLTTLKFTSLTEKFHLFDIDFMQEFDTDEDLLSMLAFTRERRVKIVHSGVIHALPYWFNIGVNKQTFISTYSSGYEGSHWQHAVYVLQDAVQVEQGDEIRVQIMVKESCISLRIEKIVL